MTQGADKEEDRRVLGEGSFSDPWLRLRFYLSETKRQLSAKQKEFKGL